LIFTGTNFRANAAHCTHLLTSRGALVHREILLVKSLQPFVRLVPQLPAFKAQQRSCGVVWQN